MKMFICLITMTCCFLLQGVSSAAVVVTLGQVTGVNTELDVSIRGSGVLGVDTFYTKLFPIPDAANPPSPNATNVNFFTAATRTENNIGDIVSSTFTSPYAQPLSTPITLSNLTDTTSVLIEYIMFDHDSPFPNVDDFHLVFFAPDAFIEPGDAWSISGYSKVVLGKGNASDFYVGTYSYTDDATGEVTLIIQENTASIPEASTALSFVLGVVLLMVIGQRRIVQRAASKSN